MVLEEDNVPGSVIAFSTKVTLATLEQPDGIAVTITSNTDPSVIVING